MGMDGKIVHEWHYPFSKAWKHPEHIAFPAAMSISISESLMSFLTATF